MNWVQSMHYLDSNGSGVKDADSNKPKLREREIVQLLKGNVGETRLTTVEIKTGTGESVPF